MVIQLRHVQGALNEAHMALCDKVALFDQREMTPDEAALLTLIDAAIVQCQGMRVEDTDEL